MILSHDLRVGGGAVLLSGRLLLYEEKIGCGFPWREGHGGGISPSCEKAGMYHNFCRCGCYRVPPPPIFRWAKKKTWPVVRRLHTSHVPETKTSSFSVALCSLRTGGFIRRAWECAGVGLGRQRSPRRFSANHEKHSPFSGEEGPQKGERTSIEGALAARGQDGGAVSRLRPVPGSFVR